MMFLAILGRQSKISLAELESLYGPKNITVLAENLALVKTVAFDLSRMGGIIKAGQILESPLLDYLSSLPPGNITLGFSDYSPPATARTSSTEALKLKSILKRKGRSVRIVPNNSSPALSTATSHHNQLGEKTNHIEILSFGKITAISIGAQNITSYARRDQARPARDAFVGMLPPKLAQILVNLAAGPTPKGRLLDPFCGTGTILQEALLMGYSVYGTDLSEKMITYSDKNLSWLEQKSFRESLVTSSRRKYGRDGGSPSTSSPLQQPAPRKDGRARERVSSELATRDSSAKPYLLEPGDATKHKWQPPIDFIASETYLGQPFSAPPSEMKLKEVQFVTKNIILSFLKNIHPQIAPGTTLALAIPAWRRPSGEFSSLNILDEIKKLGYNLHKFKHATHSDLLYFRENQIVARQIILLRKI